MLDGWRDVRLGEVAEVDRLSLGSSTDPDFAFQYISLADVETGRIVGPLKSYRFADAPSRARRVIDKGDILISTVRPNLLGFAIVEDDHKDCIASTGFAVVTPRESVDRTYLFQCLFGPQLKVQFDRLVVGSNYPAINSNDVKNLRFKIPPLHVQRKIGEILRKWDEAIGYLEALRAAKLNHRSWLKQNLLTGRKRLSGFTREWRFARLNEILTEHGLQSTGTEEVYSVSVHRGLVNQVEHLGRSYASIDTAQYNRVLPGDIVYTKSPTGEFPLGVIKQSKIHREVIVSPLYGVFTPVSQELGVIIDAYFESPIMTRNFLHPLVQKGAKNTIAITNRRFLEGKLCVPLDLDEQRAIAVAIETSKSELTGIDSEIKMLACQKRGLMQKLLIGEWRVTV